MLTLERMAKQREPKMEPLKEETTLKVSGEVAQLVKELVALSRCRSSREYIDKYVKPTMTEHLNELIEARRVK